MPPKKKAKAAPKKKVVKTLPEGVKWQWKDGSKWKDFVEEDELLLETMREINGEDGSCVTKDFSFNQGFDTVYTIDFKAMTQLNNDSKKKRVIRRLEPKAAKAPPAGAGAGWYWWSDDDDWQPFDAIDANMLEKAFATGSTTFMTKDLTFNKGFDSLYIFDFSTMSQINTESGTSRKMQRSGAGAKKVVGHTKDADDDYALMLAGSTAEAMAHGSKYPFAAKFEASLTPEFIAAQKKRGPASLRKQKKDYGPVVSKDKHGSACFDDMLKNEKEFCGEWAVFYHSYSSAAILYEVQAAVAAVLFRFKSEFAALPRIICAPFKHIPTAHRMLEEFPKWKDRDHNQAFRLVGLCGTSSLLADDSEAPAKRVFLGGYSVGPLGGVLEKVLQSCGVPKVTAPSLAKEIIKLAKVHGLDTRGIPGGDKCKSGRSGHMLQIFLRRELIDEYVYPAFPFGVPDKKRMKPFSKYLADDDGAIHGQVRITLNPDVFLRATTARIFTYSADPTFNEARPAFQEALTALLKPILGDEETRIKAATGIFGGKPPSWWSPEDQGEAAKMDKGRYGSSVL
mmetsp:Transcript_23777/g.53943  ORF Transcript_23777/g.53943 Transcript_23777/m.53943 type:complete len:565 (-) Transcript_23777:107-1801(-)